MRSLLDRYRANFGLPDAVPLSEDQVLEHLRLELGLTQELLESTPETRFETFERCYGALYSRLHWLNASPPRANPLDAWPSLIGRAPRRVYEIGAGQGVLARALAAKGYDVVATEVTRERGAARDAHVPRLQWQVTDGVHLDRFAEAGAYDAVISDQVVEHLHPDDLLDHLRGALALLRPDGVYVFRTPHAFSGPHDVSRVFRLERPVGMHLREYTYAELVTAARSVGFGSLAAPIALPGPAQRKLRLPALVSSRYLRYLLDLERRLARSAPGPRRHLAKALLPPVFRRDVWLLARKPQAER